jgi:hypothetical protein
MTVGAKNPDARARAALACGLHLRSLPDRTIAGGTHMHRHARNAALVTALSLGLAHLAVPPVEAGCGCEKAPPPPAQVRPNVTYAGAAVTLFGSSLIGQQEYTVTFTSGTTGATASVKARVESRKDLADGVVKPQLTVIVPDLPLGPTSIVASRPNQSARDVAIGDAAFTVAPQPIAVPVQYGQWRYPNYRAAVDRDGVAYIALDVSGITLPMIIEAQALGYPLRFANQDALFHNVQGFLMQKLIGGDAEPIPGMFVFPEAAAKSPNSNKLRYSRHEFTTYFLQHEERFPHAVSGGDANWHVNGTRHIDHDHLILGIAGTLADGSVPAPGATPAFELAVSTLSLFEKGITGTSSLTLKSWSSTDAYDPATDEYGTTGAAFSNGALAVSDYAVVNGSVAGSKITVASTARVTGPRVASTPTSFMAVGLPPGIPTLPPIMLSASMSATINGPGSFAIPYLSVSGQSTLYVDNAEGPVTLYVTGYVNIKGNARVLVADPNPEKFAIYVTGTGTVNFGGSSNSRFYGVLYAPNAPLTINGNGDFYGAFVGKTVQSSGNARIHFYKPLKGE